LSSAAAASAAATAIVLFLIGKHLFLKKKQKSPTNSNATPPQPITFSISYPNIGPCSGDNPGQYLVTVTDPLPSGTFTIQLLGLGPNPVTIDSATGTITIPPPPANPGGEYLVTFTFTDPLVSPPITTTIDITFC